MSFRCSVLVISLVALTVAAIAGPRGAVHAQSVDPCAGAAASTDIEASAQHERHDHNTAAKTQVALHETAKVNRLRVAWEQFLSAATDSRMRVDTRLRAAIVSREKAGGFGER